MVDHHEMSASGIKNRANSIGDIGRKRNWSRSKSYRYHSHRLQIPKLALGKHLIARRTIIAPSLRIRSKPSVTKIQQNTARLWKRCFKRILWKKFRSKELLAVPEFNRRRNGHLKLKNKEIFMTVPSYWGGNREKWRLGIESLFTPRWSWLSGH